MTEVVRLVIGKGKPLDQQERYKIVFKSKELRVCAEQTGKGIIEHLQEPTGGWQTALYYGLKYSHPKVTKDQVSDLIDRWLDDDPENEYSKIGDMLMQALENGRFIKIDSAKKEDEDEGEAPAQ